jgi:ABC-type transport system involved in multi-copper enzyme maturation permease subunit
MDAIPTSKPVPINRWLPYWAVFQADVQQTLRSWVYRVWVLVSALAVVGYLLYRYAPYHQVGVLQSAAAFLSDLLRWAVLGNAALVVVLTAGSISSERGTLADSVLSRGISRYQYFLGKWHARLAVVLGTYLVLSVAASAITNSTVLGIAVLWLLIYGGGFALSLLPTHFPAPTRTLNSLPYVLRGYYDLDALGRLVGWSALASCAAALVGMVYFARRDV